MNKPFLVVVSGRPASGKSTLARVLSVKLKCPLISRDELKEGYIHTLGTPHGQLDDTAALHIYHSFFEVIDLLISKNISLIVEAAFQDRLWKPQLITLQEKAEIMVVNCVIDPDVAKERFKTRLTNDPDRNTFHGDNLMVETGGLKAGNYEYINMDVPVLAVDTTSDYLPGIKQIVDFIRRGYKRM